MSEDKYPRAEITLSDDAIAPNIHIVSIYMSELDMYEGYLDAECTHDIERDEICMVGRDGSIARDCRHFKGKKTVTVDWEKV
jgi:hypothetical protein